MMKPHYAMWRCSRCTRLFLRPRNALSAGHYSWDDQPCYAHPTDLSQVPDHVVAAYVVGGWEAVAEATGWRVPAHKDGWGNGGF